MTAFETVERLAANPMYQLSTAGQELFHSNMFYWLAENRREESVAVWELLGVPCPDKAFRELRHIDPLVEAGTKRLVLENKVLALPDPVQLRRYVDELVKNPVYATGTSWLLLSLAPPAFAIDEYKGVTWEHVSYDQLLVALRDTLGRLDGDDVILFRRYVDLVDDLVALTRAFDPCAHQDEPFQLSDADRNHLEQARLLTLVRKQQMSRCAELVRIRLADEGGFVSHMLALGAGISTKSKAGVVEHFIEHSIGRSDRRLGWQLEGNALRMVGILDPRESKAIPEDERGDVLLASYPEFFSFDFAPNGALTPYSGKKQWLKYGGEFRYQYQSVPNGTTWRQLVDLLVAASKRTRAEIAKIG